MSNTEDTMSTPPLAMQSYEFLVVIGGHEPGRIDIQRAHGIEEAQQALQDKYGPQAQITFHFIVPDFLPQDPQHRYNIPTESQRLQAELEPISEAQHDEQAVHLEGFSEDLKQAIGQRLRGGKRTQAQ
jgi:hypothetical protein